MSDHWEQFAASMGGQTAFISYDHGIRDGLADLPFPYFVSFKVLPLTQNAQGFPQGEEFEKLHQVEDFLCSQIQPADGIQVGRITTNESRFFHFYSSLSSEAIEALVGQAAALHGHAVLFSHEPDAERSHYWDELYPTEDDWQVVRDMKVQSALEQKGDSLSEPRSIRHWAYFKSSADRDEFLQAVQDRFEKIEPLVDADGELRFGLVLTHTGLPDYRSMNSTTLLLSRTARRCNAAYDGWETEVRRSSE